MNGLLSWRVADLGDRGQLQHFECTSKPKKSARTGWKPHHPKWWEYEVQSWIRRLRPPYRWPLCLLVGVDTEGLAAVAHYEELDGPAQVELLVMAIARRLRGKGGGYADEMAAYVLDDIAARALEHGVPEVLVTGLVWEENFHSQELCRRAGFRHSSMAKQGVQQWSRELFPRAEE